MALANGETNLSFVSTTAPTAPTRVLDSDNSMPHTLHLLGQDEGLIFAFQDETPLSFPILFDRDQAIYRAYQTMGVPESLLVGRDGRIIERYVGPREWDEPAYVARIREVLGPSP